ncbi:DUF3017 domain-containing protein [Modestobacter sp. NPDC049651]|uniref:DUF3017 domain-containing protein n=1 Tax=unclassified Modestobacter TaxID=2643866 RepID=UPI00340D9CCD
MAQPPGPAGTGKPPLYVRRPFLAGALRQWPLTFVVVTVGAGLVLVAVDRWRAGLVLVGCALLAGGLLRMLPERRLGFLAVRSRTIDVTLMLGAGAAVVAIALSVPAG